MWHLHTGINSWLQAHADATGSEIPRKTPCPSFSFLLLTFSLSLPLSLFLSLYLCPWAFHSNSPRDNGSSFAAGSEHGRVINLRVNIEEDELQKYAPQYFNRIYRRGFHLERYKILRNLGRLFVCTVNQTHVFFVELHRIYQNINWYSCFVVHFSYPFAFELPPIVSFRLIFFHLTSFRVTVNLRVTCIT